MKKITVLILIFNTLSLFAGIEESIIWDKSINWEANTIEIRVKTPLEKSESTLAATRIKAENRIQENITDIFFKNILDIKIDSLKNVSEIINSSPETYFKLEELGESLSPVQKQLSTNIEFLEALYRFPIYPDFVSLFYNRISYIELKKKLDHREYGKFTGLVIYVPEELPLYQKNRDGELTRVLFPKIYDEDMNLVMDLTMIEPEYMKKWGMVIYGSSFNEELYQNRIGLAPLRVIARGIFGTNNSDLIISNKEADKLIGDARNLNIISQGRILILKQEKE